jgi:peptide chain release factor subunit 1
MCSEDIMDPSERYRFKRLLEELKSKRGRGTELISVYIPQGFELAKVMEQLREELGTASNIKSKNTRKNVIDALERIIQFLKTYMETYRKPPPHGMAIFCGNVAEREGESDIRLWWIEPIEPITVRLYRCDQEFVLSPLEEMLEVKGTVGLITLDRKEATLGALRGKHVEILRRITSGVPGKHSKGGQSARRFERLREIAEQEYLKRVAEETNEVFSQIPDLQTIIVGGPGPTKEEFLKLEALKEPLRKKISAVLDCGYTDEYGIKELAAKAGEVLADLELNKERAVVQRFLSELAAGSGLAISGEDEVRRALENGAVGTLLISESLRKYQVKVKCGGCGFEYFETGGDLPFLEKKTSSSTCPQCGEKKLSLVEVKDLIQELFSTAEKFGTRVELISRETDEGEQLWRAFGGIAALLRFEMRT